MKSHISGIQIPTDSRINIDGGLTLDSLAGTSGHMMISQGTGNTPIWSNTLTSPTIVTSLLTSSPSFDLLNTTATTINFAGAATTLSIGTTTATSVLNFGTGAVTGSKEINIGTAGAAVSSTTIKVGSNVQTASSTIFLQGQTYFGQSRTGTGTTTGYGAIIQGPTTTVTGTTGNATGGDLLIYSGNASLTNAGNLAGVATSGNITIDAGSASVAYFDATAAYGSISIGTASASAVTLGKVGGNTVINGLGGLTLGGALVTATTSTSVAPLRLPTGTVPTTANQQFGMIAADAESLQLSTTKTTGAGPGFGFIRAPQMVFSLANAPASANSTTGVAAFAAANDVLSSLEANKLYTFKGKYYVTYTAGGAAAALRMLFAFANAPQAIKYNFRTTKSTSATTMEQVGIGEVTTGVNVSTSNQVTGTLTVEFDGYFTSNATTGGTITPQIAASASTSGGTFTVTTGSWFEIQKIGSATQTLIAGNWG
jgi:hypothetical protein